MKLRGLKNQAWVTAAVTDEDAKRCIVLANSLKRVLSTRSVVILVSGKVDPTLRDRLHYEFDQVFLLEEDRNNANLELFDFAKVSALALKSYEKCVFVSPKMMFLKNADEIFDQFEDACFASLENDKVLPIFVYKPSMESYNVLMKALGCRNGTPVATYIQNWFVNQQNYHQAGQLPARYCKAIALKRGTQQTPTMTDAVIVNFLDDPLTCQDWKEGKNAYLSLVDYHAIKVWLELYHEKVEEIVLGSPVEGISNGPRLAESQTGYETEPIAIIGMSCRFPGSNNLVEFWNILVNGEDATGNPPPFRWLREQCSRNRPDCRTTNAGFLKVPVDEFDSKFFGISPKEVLFMDPQHRLLHEVVWEALEDAAVDPLKLRGSNGGVFMGSWTNDFKDILAHSGVLNEFYRTFMGNSIGAAAARISFLLGMTGPSIATESGCSSAMVAVHLACRSLRLGEINTGLVGGVNLLLHPFDKDEMPMVISPTGKCHTFDSKADGFARAEGCGVLVLKRMSDAIKDGDRIWGLIRGSGMSQEGVSRSMGTPTVHGEALAMKQALRDAHVSPEEVSYVEAHGTGTVVGDPLEIRAIASAYASKSRQEPLIIGSVKTNVGHTESCSGITGVIKTVLSMYHEVIPPHCNFETLNPNIDLDIVPAKLPLKAESWKKYDDGRRRIAGVSSFGITGTDAHAIIEEPPLCCNTEFVSTLARPQHILKISAKTEEALNILLERYATSIENSQNDLEDIAFTGNIGRASFPWRTFITGKTKAEFVNKIRQNQISKREVGLEEPGKICFLFTGQGSQYNGMAQQLYSTNATFQMHFDYCEGLLKEMYGIEIRDVIWGEPENDNNNEVSRTIYSQTSIFCVEYAILKLWESWGVKPDYVLGHSLGEFAAAVCAGILRVEDALKLVAERSRLIDNLPRGKMLVIKANQGTVKQAMNNFSDGDASKILDYAAVNSNEQTVVAGDSEVVMRFAKYCADTMQLKTMVLDASHAFHSKHMDPMLNEYRKVAETIQYVKKVNCEYISGMRGCLIDAEEIDAEYWVQHTRKSVNFLEASKTATELGCQTFIEIGPQPVLSALTMINNEKISALICLPTLKKQQNDWDTILETVGKLYLKGVPIDWQGFDQLYKRKKVRLPHYPFIGKQFWPDMMATNGHIIHPLVGSLISNASSSKIFQNGFNTRCLEYVKDHAIGQTSIFPGAGYLEMALAAGHSVVECCTDSMSRPSRPMKVENLKISAPLALEESKTSQVQIVVDFNNLAQNGGNDWSDLSVKIFHRLDSKWLQHASASFIPLPSAEEVKKIEFDFTAFQKLREQPSDDTVLLQIYDKLASVGLKFGPIFQSIEKVWKAGNVMLSKVKIPTVAAETQQYIIHPVVLDSMIQAVMMQKHSEKIKKKLYVPISIAKFLWLANARGEELYVYTKDAEPNQAILVDEVGTVIAFMSGIELIPTTVKAVDSILEEQTSVIPDMWEESWRSKPGPMSQRIPEDVLWNTGFTEEFQQHMKHTYNTVPGEKEKIFKLLEKYVYLWILNALYECGWKPKVGDTFSTKGLVQKLGIEVAHTKFVNWFMEVLEKNDIMERVSKDSNDWRVTANPTEPEAVQSQLNLPIYTEKLVEAFDPTRLIKRVGENLAGIFKGSQSPLQVLFPENTKNTPSVSGFYDEYGSGFNVVGTISDTQRKRLTSWLEQHKGDNFVFRIIEIGAGTGIFTSHVLPVIAEKLGVNFEYTFTDISQAFLSTDRFDKYKSNMKFKKLNIEEDPISQGFNPEYYDYVVASDVIHATKDVVASLCNVRKLLRKGGNFDILEQMEKNHIITFIFGLMEGFWRMEDFRKDHCILTASQWKSCLEQAGFAQITTFPSFNGRHGLITSHAGEVVYTSHTCNEPTTTPVWLLFSTPNCKLSQYIADQLVVADRRAIHIQPGTQFDEESSVLFKVRGTDKTDFEQLMNILRQKRVKVEGIVYMWPLDKTRRTQEEILQPYFNISQTVFSLKQKVIPRICTITQGVAPISDSDLSHFHPSTILGFTKTYRNENIDINCRCISVTNDVKILSEPEMKEVFMELWSEDKETQIAYSNGQRHVARFQPLKVSSEALSIPVGTNRFQLILPETKTINDLQFGTLEQLILEDKDIEIQIKASALNFKDVLSVMKPTEEFKNINTVGFDFAGVVKRTGAAVTNWRVGDYVFGCNFTQGALPSHIKMPEDAVVPVPDDLTQCEAATLPAVFSTSYYCLMTIAKMKQGDTVLLHTASGGVGLAAIQICRQLGANIIATAGSHRKRSYLKSIGIQHVFNSRNTNYEKEIMEVTKGQGVDIVLNSLTGPGFKEASLAVCAPNGRFVEMSKLSIWSDKEVCERRPDVDYTIVDLTQLDKEIWKQLLLELKNKLHTGIMQPIPYVRFDALNIRQALQYLQQAKHIGKVVCVMPEVRVEDGEYKTYTPLFNDRSTYLVTGGLGGIGFEVCRWMLQTGAKNVLLASRRQPDTEAQNAIEKMNFEGANVIPVQLDIGNYQQCNDLFEKIKSSAMNLPKLRGIMHAAGTLNDGLIANQDWEKLASTFNAKINGTLNLHELTLECPLEHFVLFSSVVSLFGNPGQSNHAAGNGFEDAIAHYRNSIGLPAKTINWGQWGEIGVAVEVELPGMKAISTLQGISALDFLMRTQRLQTTVMNMESFVLFSKLSPMLAVYLDERIWKTGGSSSTSITIKSDEFWQQYDSKEDRSDKVSLLKFQLKDILRKVLKLENEEPVDDDGNFQEMGVDSLMFVELKNAVQSLLGERVTVSSSALRDCHNVTLLSDQIIKLIEGEDGADEPKDMPSFEEIADLMREDCVLPEHITAVGRPFKNIFGIGTVLLTGVTGTLGPYVLKELSQLPQISEIYCLIRSSKTMSLQDRLEQVLEFRELRDTVDMKKVKCIEGNVSKPKLGMEATTWEQLVQKVDAVFHFAVKADHTQSYRKRENLEDVRAVNIGGTKNVMEFACSNQECTKHVFFASTLLSVATTEEDGSLSESWPNVGDFNGVTKFAYPISKFVGDVLMKIGALERGIPTKVFRLPLISGDSKTGKFCVDQNHMMLRYLYIMKSGVMPGNPFPLVLLPVDLCAAISVKLFFHPDLSAQASDIYNITHNAPDIDQEFPALAETMGYSVEFVDFSEFAQKLFNEPEGSAFTMFKEFYKDEEELMSVYHLAPSMRKWLEGVENFWVSKKLTSVCPEFYNGLERTIHCLQRDLKYAKKEGWFEKFGLSTRPK